jgi:predicted molibdopterin-dependent oxidoreductase YjgC
MYCCKEQRIELTSHGDAYMVKIIINGQDHEVEEGERLLKVLQAIGTKIPSLCFHHALTPAASCKLCVVEVKEKDRPYVVKLACAVKTKEGLEVTTESAMIHQHRNRALGNLFTMAPQSEALMKIGAQFGLTIGPIPDGCIRCRLCIRACKEVIGARALTFEKREGRNFVVPSEKGECIGCGTCANICPTNAIKTIDKGKVRTMMVGDQVIARHPLVSCEMCGKLFATPKFMKHVEHREESHTDIKEHHELCPTCVKLYARKDLRLLTPRIASTYAGKPIE